MAGDVDDQQSISTYEDDFADEESPTLQYPEKNALPSKNPEKSYDNSTNSRSSGGYLTEGQGKDGTPSEVSATAAPAPDASVTDASITDASVSDASVTGDSPPTKLNNSNEKRENGDAASASSDENNDEQRSLDVPGTPANVNDNNNSNSNYNSSGEDEAVSESFPQAQMPSRDEDDNGHASGDRIDGGVVQPEDGGASQSAVSPTSARGLEERLQAAEAENEKLRQAREKTAGETAVDGSSGKELEMLKSQVEAARSEMCGCQYYYDTGHKSSWHDLRFMFECAPETQGEHAPRVHRLGTSTTSRQERTAGQLTYHLYNTSKSFKCLQFFRTIFHRRPSTITAVEVLMKAVTRKSSTFAIF